MGQISSVGNAGRLGRPAELPARPRRWYLVSMGSFDATLLAVAAARPRNRRDLEGLPGLGAAKVERYADALLAAIAAG